MTTSNNGHTPGPWKWFGNRSGGVYLATAHSGRKYIMGFKRYGMNGAQPLFRCNDRMVPAADLVEFEVGDGIARGFKQADKDGSVYRYDVSGIDNADARLIAAAPELLEALKEAHRALMFYEWYNNPKSGWASSDNVTVRGMVDAAIAKATGEAA